MLNKVGTKKLAIIVAGLLPIVIILFLKDSVASKGSFNSYLGYKDTSSITSILIYPKIMRHKEVRLVKEGYIWKVVGRNGKYYAVQNSKIIDLLSTINHLEAKSVLSGNSSSDKENEVDTTGTSVKVLRGDEIVYSFTIGKYTVTPPRDINTAIKIRGDAKTYSVDGFLELSFNLPPEGFRNNKLLNGTPDEVQSLDFRIGADEFTVKQSKTGWTLGDKNIDSGFISNYIRELMSVSSSTYLDDEKIDSKTKVLGKLKVHTKAGDISLMLYDINGEEAITTSANLESVFDGHEDDLAKKIFLDKEAFLQKK